MTLPLVLLPEVKDDVDAAFTWYEGQRSELGLDFLTGLASVLERVRGNPYLYGELRKRVRVAPLRRFPYVVYYRIEGAHLLIIAIMHGSRSPRHWRRRAP
jgi:toxin ParE1/3/4